jgi:hypothetical protein
VWCRPARHAAVFGDGYDTFPAATGGNFLVEILPNLF